MSDASNLLLGLLDLADLGSGAFEGGQPPHPRDHVFAGQIVAQGLMAAGRSVGAGDPRSLHAYFTAVGDPSRPIRYEVETLRATTRTAFKEVRARQGDTTICVLSCTFAQRANGLEHQFDAPSAPGPEGLPTFDEQTAPYEAILEGSFFVERPVDQRYIGQVPWQPREEFAPRQRLWMKVDGPIPEDPLLHACAVAYVSNYSIFHTLLQPHERTWGDPDLAVAAIDQCIWFHAPLRADEWFLFDADSPVATGGRGVARALCFERSGRLVTSMVQEGLVRSRS